MLQTGQKMTVIWELIRLVVDLATWSSSQCFFLFFFLSLPVLPGYKWISDDCDPYWPFSVKLKPTQRWLVNRTLVTYNSILLENDQKASSTRDYVLKSVQSVLKLGMCITGSEPFSDNTLVLDNKSILNISYALLGPHNMTCTLYV